VQFTATQEHVDLVERAQALLGRSASEALGELHLQAMRALVAQLEKRKYAVADAPARQREGGQGAGEVSKATTGEGERGRVQDKAPRQRGRYIPAALRREVFLRDMSRCTFVDGETGQRCRETRRLQFHHLDPFARGGVHSADNLTLRCAAHNRLAAEEDFGRAHMSKRSEGSAHESFSRQQLTATNGFTSELHPTQKPIHSPDRGP
jgi:5-methylcytosine-specific restriction endonuclease McrA